MTKRGGAGLLVANPHGCREGLRLGFVGRPRCGGLINFTEPIDDVSPERHAARGSERPCLRYLLWMPDLLR